MLKKIGFRLNEKPISLEVDGDRKLLWVLRTDLGLPGTKYGCGKGICGTCTVLVDREAVRACQVRVKEVRGKEVLTIEGLAKGSDLHPVQRAFLKENALQCGFCTPGMILNACSLLNKNPDPTRQEIIRAMNDSLCRCGAHPRIVQAIQLAAKEMRGAKR